MLNFYRNLKDHASPDALRLAQIETRAHYARPHCGPRSKSLESRIETMLRCADYWICWASLDRPEALEVGINADLWRAIHSHVSKKRSASVGGCGTSDSIRPTPPS